MQSVGRDVTRFSREDEGASMAEYALMLAIVVVGLTTVRALFKDEIANVFTTTTNSLKNT